MTQLLSPTAVRVLFLAALLACAAALTAPAARGGEVANPTPPIPTQNQWDAGVGAPPASIVFPAEEWSWSEFVKYWGRQAGSLQGVVGTVMLVALAAVLIIISKGRY
jgi:hypothetical protein